MNDENNPGLAWSRAQRENFQYFALEFEIFSLSDATRIHHWTACHPEYLRKSHTFPEKNSDFQKKIPVSKKNPRLGNFLYPALKKNPRSRPGKKTLHRSIYNYSNPLARFCMYMCLPLFTVLNVHSNTHTRFSLCAAT